MKRSLFLVMVLVLFSVTSCSNIGLFSKKASLADNVNGKWKCVLEEMGGMELIYDFKIDGDTLTGSVASEMGDMVISNGEVTEDSFSFNVDANGQMIVHSCKYSDGVILMEVPMMDGTLTLTRVPE